MKNIFKNERVRSDMYYYTESFKNRIETRII